MGVSLLVKTRLVWLIINRERNADSPLFITIIFNRIHNLHIAYTRLITFVFAIKSWKPQLSLRNNIIYTLHINGIPSNNMPGNNNTKNRIINVCNVSFSLVNEIIFVLVTFLPSVEPFQRKGNTIKLIAINTKTSVRSYL